MNERLSPMDTTLLLPTRSGIAALTVIVGLLFLPETFRRNIDA